ncbi:MAG: metallophosphoesterase family protein [Bacteroidota bacterium]|nr:metallophosphoesterase family protein [Bacteroidota bacterium]
MKKIGLLSDTHGYTDENIEDFFSNRDEIWHAGDIGDYSVIENLNKIAPVKAVYGNIDDAKMRTTFPEHLRINVEKVKVWMTHIGGYPGRYDSRVKPDIYNKPPKLFISGHSHILKIQFDKRLNLLHINPGAYGKNGFHKMRTAVRFSIDKDRIKDLEVYEIER